MPFRDQISSLITRKRDVRPTSQMITDSANSEFYEINPRLLSRHSQYQAIQTVIS